MQFTHEVIHCEKCGNGYCAGCFGLKCPHCEMSEYLDVLLNRIDNLQFCLDHCAEYTKDYDSSKQTVNTLPKKVNSEEINP